MSHKTMINGVSYNITGGKTLINSTAYSIAGGKTLVSGTAYDISFGVDLAELFRGMTVLATAGKNSSSIGTVAINPYNVVDIGEKAYIFSFCNGHMSITKFARGTAITESDTLYESSADYGHVGYNGGTASTTTFYYCNKIASEGTNKVYGATLALVQFNQPEAKVDAAIRSIRYLASSGRDSSTRDYVSISIADYDAGDLSFVAYGTNFAVNTPSGYIGGTNFEIPNMLSSNGDGGYSISNAGGNYRVYSGTIHVVGG